MKTKNILQKLKAALDLDDTKKKKSALNKAFKKLKAKKKIYKERLANTENKAEKSELEDKLKVIKAQHKKGLIALRKLMKK